MRMKEFDNYDYGFAKKKDAEVRKRNKIIAIAFGILLTLFTLWSILESLGFFNQISTRFSQPIQDVDQRDEFIANLHQQAVDRYREAQIPYYDPQNRFQINFYTPYLSSQIVVIINTPENRNDIVKEADAIIASARNRVEISEVTYVDAY